MQKVKEEIKSLQELLAQSIKTKMSSSVKSNFAKPSPAAMAAKDDVKKAPPTPVRTRPATSRLG